MGCLGNILFLFLQIIIFLLAAVGSVVGLPYLTAQKYSPGDTPDKWFRVVVVEENKTKVKGPVYNVYKWPELERLKKRIPSTTFLLPDSEFAFEPEERGEHEKFRVIQSSKDEQVVEVSWSGDDYATVSRYRADKTGVTPLYYRMSGIPQAMMGLLIGFVLAVLSAFPIRRLLKKRFNKKTGISPSS